jgi:trans-AT polyketide synthase/acyltransferase/oxidoreductase domain-containing protein/rhizoxin biosynthesis acyltransferase
MAQASGGGMLAIIGLAAERVEVVLRVNGLSRIDVANFNSPLQTVISGPLEDIRRAQPIFDTAGAQMAVPLQVSAAFHSRYMADAARAFESFLAPVALRPPRMPVIANVTASAYPDDPAAIKSLLTRQITHSVRWTDTVRNLIAQGITEFREIGPGIVLTRLVQSIRDVPAVPVRQPARDRLVAEPV